MCTKYPEIWNALSAPFHTDNVKQLTQVSEKTGRSFACDYVTARTIMNRLDDVMGPENWWDDYTPIEHGAICRLTLRLPDGQLLTKVDSGAESTKLKDAGDADKGGMSDAFKRAAIKFGPGRYLYKDGVVSHGEPPAVAAPPAVRRAITAPPIAAAPPSPHALRGELAHTPTRRCRDTLPHWRGEGACPRSSPAPRMPRAAAASSCMARPRPESPRATSSLAPARTSTSTPWKPRSTRPCELDRQQLQPHGLSGQTGRLDPGRGGAGLAVDPRALNRRRSRPASRTKRTA